MNGFTYQFDPAEPLTLEDIAKSARLCRLETCLRPEEPSFKLNICSGCKNAYYCSRECQKMDWPWHKQSCKITQQTFSHLKSHKSPRTGSSYNAAMVTRMMRKWSDLHENLIHIGAIHALDLQANPDNCLTKALVLNVSPVFDPQVRIRDDPATRRSFEVSQVYVENISTLLQHSPAHRDSVQAVLDESWRMRSAGTCFGLVLAIVGAPEYQMYLSKTIVATPGIIRAAWNLDILNEYGCWQDMFKNLLALGVASEGFTVPVAP